MGTRAALPVLVERAALAAAHVAGDRHVGDVEAGAEDDRVDGDLLAAAGHDRALADLGDAVGHELDALAAERRIPAVRRQDALAADRVARLDLAAQLGIGDLAVHVCWRKSKSWATSAMPSPAASPCAARTPSASSFPISMHSFFVEIIQGIEPVASVRGFGLLLCSSGEDPGKERSELDMLRGRQVDGIVLASAHGSANDDLLKQLTGGGTGLVMIDRDDHPKVECHRVLTDDERVGIAGDEPSAGSRPSGHCAHRWSQHRARQAPRARLARGAQGARHPRGRRLVRAGGIHGERRLPRHEAAADGAPANRRGLRRQRSRGHRRHEGDLGSRPARARGHRASWASGTSRWRDCCACRSRR